MSTVDTSPHVLHTDPALLSPQRKMELRMKMEWLSALHRAERALVHRYYAAPRFLTPHALTKTLLVSRPEEWELKPSAVYMPRPRRAVIVDWIPPPVYAPQPEVVFTLYTVMPSAGEVVAALVNHMRWTGHAIDPHSLAYYCMKLQAQAAFRMPTTQERHIVSRHERMRVL